ncbi:MAG: peroxide stress protein YaaA [Campylobacterota bacterium]|nr:peroxide stress protein YaaA [Campylobacterota bacterium]
MLHILFSPAESKHPGGNHAPLNHLLFDLPQRMDILNTYNTLVLSDNKEALHKMFGLKKENELERFTEDIFSAPTCKAIERYKGVAYEYLNIKELDSQAKTYLQTHCIIFSNLYGPIYGGDYITDYKVKQGEMIDAIAPEYYYKKAFSDKLDLLLESGDILDLRAGHYDKFYKPNKAYTTLKFMKNGKVVSHWAKAYRGIVLRELALAQINCLDALHKLDIQGLHVREIKKMKLKTEIVFDIVE